MGLLACSFLGGLGRLGRIAILQEHRLGMLHRIAMLPEKKQSLVSNRAALDFCLLGNPRVRCVVGVDDDLLLLHAGDCTRYALSTPRQQHFTKFHKVSFVKAQKSRPKTARCHVCIYTIAGFASHPASIISCVVLLMSLKSCGKASYTVSNSPRFDSTKTARLVFVSAGR